MLDSLDSHTVLYCSSTTVWGWEGKIVIKHKIYLMNAYYREQSLGGSHWRRQGAMASLNFHTWCKYSR